jgi:hypothetical protein
MKLVPIVAVAYNRPNSLKRLLCSIKSASYQVSFEVELVISIDYSGSSECEKIAMDFEWKYGPKRIIIHKENLGLRKHILSCGDIALDNDAVIILEDDCFVSRDFYNFAQQALEFYQEDSKIAGISLYSYQLNENAMMPFEALKDGHDVYFMQVPCSWGQLWSNKQWQHFKKYYSTPQTILETDRLPKNAQNWPETSWKKYFYRYMVYNDLFFVFPQISHSINYGDIGTHYFAITQILQVPLSNACNKTYNLIRFKDSFNKYDAYFEILPECLIHYGFRFSGEFVVDTYCTKQYHVKDKPFVLTTQKSDKAIHTYGIEMKPLINNIIYNNKGNELSLIPIEEHFEQGFNDNIIINHYNISYNIGFKNGKVSILQSKTYKFGRILKNIFDIRKWIKF